MKTLCFAAVLPFVFCVGTATFLHAKEESLDRTGTQWAPFLQWSLHGSIPQDNPFDVEATVTFIHKQSGEQHTTGMFYDGDNRWKFRFTATHPGLWTFTTKSSDPQLNARHGKVLVAPNEDLKIKGFLSSRGNKYAIQRGENGQVEGYVFNVYMGRVHFDAYLESFGTNSTQVAKKTEAYLNEARSNGCEIIFVHVNNNWLKYGARRHDEHKNENPDPTCFRVLETIITTAHRVGGRVHLWAWGDESRKWTPLGIPGGINGAADHRLQRYIAARLGPLPGWTFGYGFDLHEWTTSKNLNAWSKYMHHHFGWQHLLCSRGFRLEGPNNINSYDGFGRNVPLHSSHGGPHNYQEIVAHLASIPNTPHLYEERHTYRRKGFQLDMDGTRRLLWWQVMAGGMGGFIGFYPATSSAFAGYPYPHAEQLQTYYTFWNTHRRFRLDMQQAKELCREKTIMLRSADGRHSIVYAEDSKTLEVDLSGMKGPQPAVAINTKKAYHEIDLGILQPKSQTISLPTLSDWAIAIGKPRGSE